MACRLLRVWETIGRSVKQIHGTNNVLDLSKRSLVSLVQDDFLKTHTPLNCTVRYTNFFNKVPAESLWKGVLSVSNAGRKRGRGKGVAKKGGRNLNKGQVIGFGKANILWPGLTVPILRGRELIQQQQLPEDPEREAKLIKLRNEMGRSKSQKLHPLDRGWSGKKMPGRSIGCPDPIGEETFEGFDTKVLESKSVFNMTGNMGRKRKLSVFVVTGNGNGLAGFALGKAMDSRAAVRKAKNRSGQKLLYINIYNGHTVYHDFFTQFGATKIFVQKKEEGYGLSCHRAIKTCCEVIGIKDLHAKIEGPTNLQHIVKAFFLGLLQQKTLEQLAEEKKLHLVEIRKECDDFPHVVASPSVVRKSNQIPRDETLDFTQYVMKDRVVLKRKKYPPFYTKHRSWEIRLRKQEYLRNQEKTKIRLLAEYGEIRSFLTDKYPESRQPGAKRNAALEKLASSE